MEQEESLESLSFMLYVKRQSQAKKNFTVSGKKE